MIITAVLTIALNVSAVSDVGCAISGTTAPNTAKIQGATLPYVHCGSGSPTIVFEGGFGGDLQNWASLLPMVGEFAPVFAYSRPGFRGASGTWDADADGVRTSEESARLLHELLLSTGVRPPYLLVGHSLGGLYIQKFAQLYPTDTAGLVLMDNRPATLMKRCAGTGIPECKGYSVSPDWSAALKATFLGIEQSESVAPTPAQLGSMPVLVITAGIAEEGVSQRYFEGFRAAQLEFVKELKRGRQKTIVGATHSSLSTAQAVQTAKEIHSFWDELQRSR